MRLRVKPEAEFDCADENAFYVVLGRWASSLEHRGSALTGAGTRGVIPISTSNVNSMKPSLLLALAAGLAMNVMAAESKPNLVLIMADDLGYETIGANGGTSYQTPVLDRLAATGVRFSHCYAQPLCTPTRVQLMTGLYNCRNYINFGNMEPGSVTFGNLLKQAGYATGITGKWQLGRDPGLPKKFGFDEWCLWQHTRLRPRYANPGLEINGVEKDYSNGEYGPDIVNDYALDFIKRNKGGPFFLYYPMILTHAPYQPTPDSPGWDPKAQGESVNKSPENFRYMVEHMDKLIGKLVDRLDQLGLRTNTLVLFLGDNGTGRGTASMMGAKEVMGGKGSTQDAGMHVPLIVNWPGRVPPGKVCEDLVDTTDFLPTLLAAAQTKPPSNLPLDGRSFLPQLLGQPGAPRSWIYSWYSPRMRTNLTVREFAFDQKHKLYRTGEFYDLTKDPQEQTPIGAANRSSQQQTAAKELQAALDQFANARPAGLDRPGTYGTKKEERKKNRNQ